MERLDKLISADSGHSRSEVKRLAREGRITVNGLTVTDASVRVDGERDAICIDGSPYTYRDHIYIMMNKPAGVISASSDARAETVMDIVPDELRRGGLFPAGRLDRDTVGFLLITDDGQLAHNMLSPKKHVPKTYEALLDGPVPDGTAESFARGITLRDGTELKPAKLKRCGDAPDRYEIVITEGRYHQVKRMFASVGRRVLELKRTKIGSLELDRTLAPGECREILPEELEKIFL